MYALILFMLGFICKPCQHGAEIAALPMPETPTALRQRLHNIQAHHDVCPGGTWCDCQHLPTAVRR